MHRMPSHAEYSKKRAPFYFCAKHFEHWWDNIPHDEMVKGLWDIRVIECSPTCTLAEGHEGDCLDMTDMVF